MFHTKEQDKISEIDFNQMEISERYLKMEISY